jgi:hypothetical protein
MRFPPINVDYDRSCLNCKYFRTEKEIDKDGSIEIISDCFNCAAFPEGIPDDVYDNGHFEVCPKQTGELVFEKK